MKTLQLKTIAVITTSLLMAFTSSHVQADDSVSANVALSTEYVWRGVSQSLEDPAISGGLDWAPNDNWYLGTWGSNVDFGSVEHLELDLYGGWTTELSNGLGIDIGFIQYMYFDDSNDIDFLELNAGLSHSGFSGTVSYDPDSKWTYLDFAYAYELSNGIGLSAHIGNYDLDDLGDYTDYSIGASASYAGLDFGLTYHDTDQKLTDQLIGGDSAFHDLFKGRVVLSVGRSF